MSRWMWGIGLLLAAGATAIVFASCATNTVVHTPYDEAIWSLAMGVDGSVFVGTEHGVYHSVDDGRSWESLYRKDDIQPIVALRTDDLDRALLAGTLDGRVVVICLLTQGSGACPTPVAAHITDYPITSIAAVNLAFSIEDTHQVQIAVTATVTSLGDGAFHFRYTKRDGVSATRLGDWDVVDAWHDSELWCAMDRQPQPLSVGMQGDLDFQGHAGMEFVGRRGTYYQFDPDNRMSNLPTWAVGPKLVTLAFRHYPDVTECAASGDGTVYVKDKYGRLLTVANGIPQAIFASKDNIPVNVYALGAGPRGHVTVVTRNGIYVSDNDGVNWRPVGSPGPTQDRSLAALTLGWVFHAAYAAEFGFAVDVATQFHPIKIDSSFSNWKSYDTSQDVIHAFSTRDDSVAKVQYQVTTPSVSTNVKSGQVIKFPTTYSVNTTPTSPVVTKVTPSSQVLAGPQPTSPAGHLPGNASGNRGVGSPTNGGEGGDGGGIGSGGIGVGGTPTGSGGTYGSGGGPPPPITVRFVPVIPGCEFTTTDDNINCEKRYIEGVEQTVDAASDIEYIYEQWALADFTGVYRDAEAIAADRLFAEAQKLADEMAEAERQRELQRLFEQADRAAKQAPPVMPETAIQDTRRLLNDIDDEIDADHARRNSSSSSVSTTAWHPSAPQPSNGSGHTSDTQTANVSSQPSTVYTSHAYGDNGPAMQALREAATRGYASGCVFDHNPCHH